MSGGAGELVGSCHQGFGRAQTFKWVLSPARCFGECLPSHLCPPQGDGGREERRAESESAPRRLTFLFPSPSLGRPGNRTFQPPPAGVGLDCLLRGAAARWPVPPCPSSQVKLAASHRSIPWRAGAPPEFRSVWPTWVGEPAFLAGSQVDADAASATREKLPVRTS